MTSRSSSMPQWPAAGSGEHVLHVLDEPVGELVDR
jgi:hypothetical protein